MSTKVKPKHKLKALRADASCIPSTMGLHEC